MNLVDYICKFRRSGLRIPGNWIRKIFRQIVKGVDFMHRNNTLHRDLKASNVLINVNNGLVKIADLGLARHFNLPFGKYTNQIGRAGFFRSS